MRHRRTSRRVAHVARSTSSTEHASRTAPHGARRVHPRACAPSALSRLDLHSASGDRAAVAAKPDQLARLRSSRRARQHRRGRRLGRRSVHQGGPHEGDSEAASEPEVVSPKRRSRRRRSQRLGSAPPLRSAPSVRSRRRRKIPTRRSDRGSFASFSVSPRLPAGASRRAATPRRPWRTSSPNWSS